MLFSDYRIHYIYSFTRNPNFSRTAPITVVCQRIFPPLPFSISPTTKFISTYTKEKNPINFELAAIFFIIESNECSQIEENDNTHLWAHSVCICNAQYFGLMIHLHWNIQTRYGSDFEPTAQIMWPSHKIPI